MFVETAEAIFVQEKARTVEFGHKNSVVDNLEGGEALVDQLFGGSGMLDASDVLRGDLNLKVGAALAARDAVILQRGCVHSGRIR